MYYIVPWTTRVRFPNGISIGSSVFAGFMVVTNRQAERQTGTDDEKKPIIHVVSTVLWIKDV